MTETPDPSGSPEPLAQRSFDEFYEELMEMTRELTKDVRAEWHRVKEDRTATAHLKSKLRTDLIGLLTQSMDTEGKINEHRIKRAGNAGEYALDLGAARLEIGRRLNSIRTAGRAEGVS